MNDDIKSMIKSRRDQRYHGSAYSEDQITKAIADHKEKLLPILNKFRNKQPLTPEEKEFVSEIVYTENRKTTEGQAPYVDAFDDGVKHVYGSLDAGVYPGELHKEIGDRRADADKKRIEQRPSHSNELNPDSPAGELQGAIRHAADSMGTGPRTLAADEAKNHGMEYAERIKHADDDDDDDDY